MKNVLSIALTVLLLSALFLAPHPWRVETVQAQGGSCDKSVVISQAAAASAVLVASRPGFTTRVCGFIISGDTLATTAVFSTGTGTTCGTGTVNLTGAMRMPDEGSIVYSATDFYPMVAFGNDLCLTAATGAITGILNYQQ